MSTEGGETTATNWKWFDAMDMVMGQRPSITPPNPISSAMASSPQQWSLLQSRNLARQLAPRGNVSRSGSHSLKSSRRERRRSKEKWKREALERERREEERRHSERTDRQWREWMDSRAREEQRKREERERERELSQGRKANVIVGGFCKKSKRGDLKICFFCEYFVAFFSDGNKTERQ